MRKSETKCTRHSFAGSQCCKGCTCSCSESTGTAGLPFYQNASYYSFSFIALNSPRHLLEAKVGGGLLQKRVSPFIIPFQKTFLFTYSASHCFAKPFSWAVCIDLTFALYNSCFLICLAGWFLGFLLWACQGDSINTVSRKKKKRKKTHQKNGRNINWGSIEP